MVVPAGITTREGALLPLGMEEGATWYSATDDAQVSVTLAHAPYTGGAPGEAGRGEAGRGDPDRGDGDGDGGRGDGDGDSGWACAPDGGRWAEARGDGDGDGRGEAPRAKE